jgi:hypothetical protein
MEYGAGCCRDYNQECSVSAILAGASLNQRSCGGCRWNYKNLGVPGSSPGGFIAEP